jgi:hypothetical protein
MAKDKAEGSEEQASDKAQSSDLDAAKNPETST